MQIYYDLTVQLKGSTVPNGALLPLAQPYGSFSPGHSFEFNGKRYTIEEVVHAIVPHGVDMVSRTLLVLGPYGPHAASGPSFPQVASGSGSGGGWVVGNG
ncbi:hypothetical protein [Methylobacterium sp. Gmos1]